MDWTVVVEGETDAAVARAILSDLGQRVRLVIAKGGKTKLDPHVRGYAHASTRSPWLVLRDLDREVCAPSLVRRLLPNSTSRCLRIAVRGVEAWLLADQERCARWLGVPPGRIPTDVENCANPKGLLFDLARQSKSGNVRVDIVPTGTRSIGPGYVDQVRAFCAKGWRPRHAARRSDSLRRCLEFVQARMKA